MPAPVPTAPRSASTATAAAGPGDARTVARSPAVVVLAGLFAVGVVARAGFDLWHPPLDDSVFDPAHVRELGSTTWLVMHAAVGGPSAVLTFAGLGALVALACTGRGSLLAAVGALLTTLGSLAFAVGVAAEGVAWWYATADGVLDRAAGDAAMAAFSAHRAPVDVPALGGALAVTVGVLLLLAALWRAGAAPRWLLLTTTALAVLSGLPLPGWLVPVAVVAQATALAAVGRCALRSAAQRVRDADRSAP